MSQPNNPSTEIELNDQASEQNKSSSAQINSANSEKHPHFFTHLKKVKLERLPQNHSFVRSAFNLMLLLMMRVGPMLLYEEQLGFLYKYVAKVRDFLSF